MVIVRIMGGLGNQMQQYSLYRALLARGKEAKLDLSWFDGVVQQNMLAPRELELSRFEGLPYEEACKAEIKAVAGSSLLGKVARRLGGKDKVFHESEMYHPEIFGMDDVLLEGYWANTKYYEDILPQLRDLFTFPASRNPEIADLNEQTIREMISDQVFSVAIHLRRGDYLDAANAELLGGICTEEYYAGAMRYIEQVVDEQNAVRAAAGLPAREIRIYVFSDDTAFAREQRFGTRGEAITVCDWNQGTDSLLDMQLMSSVDALVTANSTFSFWGGRLNRHCGQSTSTGTSCHLAVTDGVEEQGSASADGKRSATVCEPILIRPLYHRNNQTPDPAIMHEYWRGWTLIDRDGNIV